LLQLLVMVVSQVRVVLNVAAFTVGHRLSYTGVAATFLGCLPYSWIFYFSLAIRRQQILNRHPGRGGFYLPRILSDLGRSARFEPVFRRSRFGDPFEYAAEIRRITIPTANGNIVEF
jgi:hypothetical protein